MKVIVLNKPDIQLELTNQEVEYLYNLVFFRFSTAPKATDLPELEWQFVNRLRMTLRQYI